MLQLRFGARLGFEAWLIQRWSLGHLSHVDIVMRDGQLLGARADGVQLRSPNYARLRHIVLAEIPAEGGREAAFYDFVTGQIGRPYDNLALLSFVMNREWQSEERWTCSELPARGLEVAGLVPRLYLPTSKITPVSLALLVSAIPGVTMREIASQ